MNNPPVDLSVMEALGAEPLAIEEAGAGFVAYVRPFSYAEFREYTNEGSKGGDAATNANTMAMHRACVYPSRAEVAKAYRDFPATRGLILGAVERFAGKFPERWIRFDSKVDVELLEELKIPAETAASLLTKYPLLGQLWIAHVPDLDVVLVVRRPTAVILERLFEKTKEAYFDAALEASIDCTVWARDRETCGGAEVVATIYRELPALPGNVVTPELIKMIRGGQSAEKKGFMPKGRRSAAT